MNKKFSTLVASILLASSVGAYAQIPLGIPDGGITSSTNVSAYKDGKGGYEVGKSYFLSVGSDAYLYANTDAKGQVVLETRTFANGKFASITEANKTLWEVVKINAPVGAIAPQYTFVNKATRTVLSMNRSQAVAFDKAVSNGSNVMGGDQVEWLSAPSYKDPAAAPAPVYASIANDNVIALVLGADVKDATNVVIGNKVVLASMAASEVGTNGVKITPQVPDAAGSKTFVLTPNELNTLLGAAGTKATKDNFFQLSFDPTATMEGNMNKLSVDLQAVALQQYDLKYGEKDESKELIITEFTSLRPRSSKAIPNASGAASDKFSDIVSSVNENAVNYGSGAAETPQWVALRNRDGEYLVVDTMYINGTKQNGNGLITFKWDGLYNAKDKQRYRNPESYLFRFNYDVVTGTVTIQSKKYYAESATPDGTATTVIKGASGWYDGGYASKPVIEGSTWINGTDVENAYITRAELVNTTEVTLGNTSDPTAAPTGKDAFTIKLGNSAAYQTTYVPSGAYLLKVTGSKTETASRIGKYYVNNLKGGFEIMEQAVRQDFQHMPAAQWVVKSAGTTNGSPITILNREFAKAPEGVPHTGTVYSAGLNQVFFMGGDTLEFIKVTAPLDEKLGYKYVANDTIQESLFTFNYLHDLAMDKPINTKDDRDSVVWVDKNGNATKFMLEVVADDTYGTNNGVAGISKNLTRRVYNVKVNDATKLQNDKRYLAYDNDSKKYKVSEGAGDMFFLKENNTADGTCYYTFVKANVYPAVKLDVNGATATKVDARTGLIVADADASDYMFLAKSGEYTNPVDGLKYKGLILDATKEARNSDTYDAKIFDQIQITGAIATEGSEANAYVLQFKPAVENYADYKVSVDNNTLDLVNGVLNNQNSQEVATSAFAVKRDADPLYRRFNTVNEGVATDAPDTVKFYRVNASVKEYLYEDANSAYSKDKGFNFLGVEGKGDVKNASIYVDTAYVRNNTRMPQYMLALRPTFVKGETILCDATTHAHATPAEALACPHTKITPTYVDATYLVNLQDSIDTHVGASAIQAKYQWNKQYTRLGFVDARHIHDTLVIKNSVYTGNNKPIQIGKAATWASKDSIFLGNNMHKNVVFSFRMVKSGSNDFLIESETEQYNEDSKTIKNVKNSALKATKIAPEFGGWVKIQNGVPVIANEMKYSEVGLDAEIFNVEATSEAPTTNEGIDATAVSIVAGNGNVTVKNAEGKSIAISNILGQSIVNTVITSDNATISVPAGIVVVSVEGEDAVKAIVK